MGSTSKKPKFLKLWRLVKSRHVATAFDGEGAFRFGGRWNSRGQRVVYASDTLSLALLEVLVHIDSSGPTPSLSVIPIDVPLKAISYEHFSTLETVSGGLPWSLGQTRAWGDEWNKVGKTAVLSVPSTIVPNESNYLINPSHPSLKELKIGAPQAIDIDPRLPRLQ